MKKIFKDIKNNEFVLLYTDYSSMKNFCFGKIAFINTDYIIIHLFTPDGYDDGYYLIKTERITYIKNSKKYIQIMEKLINYHNQNIDNYVFKETNPVYAILGYAKTNNKIVSLELADSRTFDCLGFIEEFNESFCKIHSIDNYGEDNGTVYISMDRITSVSVDSEEERTAQYLWKRKSEK